jgi:hypothetical protein
VATFCLWEAADLDVITLCSQQELYLLEKDKRAVLPVRFVPMAGEAERK